MGRIEEAAEALKQQQVAAESDPSNPDSSKPRRYFLAVPRVNE